MRCSLTEPEAHRLCRWAPTGHRPNATPDPPTRVAMWPRPDASFGTPGAGTSQGELLKESLRDSSNNPQPGLWCGLERTPISVLRRQCRDFAGRTPEGIAPRFFEHLPSPRYGVASSGRQFRSSGAVTEDAPRTNPQVVPHRGPSEWVHPQSTGAEPVLGVRSRPEP